MEALDLIAMTGTTKEKLKQLRRHVDEAQSRVATPIASEEIAQEVVADARRLEALRKIYAWVTAWSEMARTVVKRRDLQIRLGLAKPRRAKANANAGAKKTKAPPAPPVVAVPVSMMSASAADEEHGPASRAA